MKIKTKLLLCVGLMMAWSGTAMAQDIWDTDLLDITAIMLVLPGELVLKQTGFIIKLRQSIKDM